MSEPMKFRHCASCTCLQHQPTCQGRCASCHPEEPFEPSLNHLAIQLADVARASSLGKFQATLHDGSVVQVRVAQPKGARKKS
jgi:hypothetical protein